MFKNKKFIGPKNAILGYLMIIFTVRDSFSQNLLPLCIHYIYIGYFLCLTLTAKKNCLKGERRISNKKKYFGFFTPSKKITVYIPNKKWEFKIFPTVLESYSKSFMEKIGEKYIPNYIANDEKQCLTFFYWRFFSANTVLCLW